MSELYREEECFWIYRDGLPLKRSSRNPSDSEIYDLQAKNPTSTFTIKKEERRVSELRSFSPLQRQDLYNKN